MVTGPHVTDNGDRADHSLSNGGGGGGGGISDRKSTEVAGRRRLLSDLFSFIMVNQSVLLFAVGILAWVGRITVQLQVSAIVVEGG